MSDAHGHCGTCGVSTQRLPCWSCELEQQILHQIAAADKAEEDK